MKSSGSNVITIRNENRALIFRCIRECPKSRADIAHKTGLSKSSVTTITNALIKEGQIVEVGTNDTAIGRKPILLDIVASFRFAAGIYLHRKQTFVCLTDLKSQIIAQKRERTSRWSDPYKILKWSCDTIQALASENGLSMEKCIGVGISAPGPLDYLTGCILTPPNFEMFHGINAVEEVKRNLDLPTMLDNNAVLLAIQEYNTNRKHHFENYIFIIIEDGIGSAIMTKGGIYRGYKGFTGEIGHTSIDIDGIPCSCGNKGCLEQYVTLSALKKHFGFDSYEKVVDDAYTGEMYAREILEYIAEHLSCAIINAVNFFDLDAAILYGEFRYRSSMLEKMIYNRVHQKSIICNAHTITVKFSNIDANIADSSVTTAILEAYFNQKLQ